MLFPEFQVELKLSHMFSKYGDWIEPRETPLIVTSKFAKSLMKLKERLLIQKLKLYSVFWDTSTEVQYTFWFGSVSPLHIKNWPEPDVWSFPEKLGWAIDSSKSTE